MPISHRSLTHNELVGFDYPKPLVKKLFVFWLTGPADSRGVTNRVKVVDKILKSKRITTMVLKAKGRTGSRKSSRWSNSAI